MNRASLTPVRNRPYRAARGAARPGRNALALGVLISVLLHAAVVLSFRFHVVVARVSPELPPASTWMRPIEVFAIRETSEDVPPLSSRVIVRDPAVLPATIVPLRSEGIDLPATANPVARRDPVSVEDRLQYHRGSGHVWQRAAGRGESEDVRTEEEVLERRIARRIAAMNDTIAADAAAAAGADDFTIKDGKGGRWGVSPGAVHLGSLTIPLPPITFAPPAGRRDEIAGRLRNWNEIQAQAAQLDGRSVFADRVRAINERAAREREEKKAAGGG